MKKRILLCPIPLVWILLSVRDENRPDLFISGYRVRRFVSSIFQTRIAADFEEILKVCLKYQSLNLIFSSKKYYFEKCYFRHFIGFLGIIFEFHLLLQICRKRFI